MAARGRPRTFDRAAALRQAMDVFWAKGYDAASLPDLTRAMGINAPSLYAAFGCKEALFREAVDLYVATVGSVSSRALVDAPTAREGIEQMLRAVVEMSCQPDRPKGCLVALGGLDGSPDNENVRRELIAWRGRRAEEVRQRLARGVKERDVPPGTNISALAAFYGTVAHGLGMQARDGISRATLLGIVSQAMAAWDSLVSASGTVPSTRRASRRDRTD